MSNTRLQDSNPCPCHSHTPYGQCCGPYHRGEKPENALKLMRSRYSAYALGLVDYILKTTHPQNPQKSSRKDLEDFCRQTEFIGLDILAFEDGEKKAYVTFTAHLRQNGQNTPFTEKSEFEKVGEMWLYKCFIQYPKN